MDYNKNLKIILQGALKEDLGSRDITSELVIAKDKFISAVLLAKEDFVVCGLPIAGLTFKLKDKKIKFKALVLDGQFVKKGKVLARIQGRARPILAAERVALNFLCLLCGIATRTREYVDKLKPYKVKVMDTRKTIPGLRGLQKYAVRVGGGLNHRMRLDEMVLVKDNHLRVQSSKFKVQSLARKIIPKGMKLEIEVGNLREFKEALKIRPDIIMLDNMSIKDIKKAVMIRNNLLPKTCHLKPKLEASGGVTLENVRKVASTGVDMISVGELTHSINSTDISLEVL